MTFGQLVLGLILVALHMYSVAGFPGQDEFASDSFCLCEMIQACLSCKPLTVIGFKLADNMSYTQPCKRDNN